MAGKIKALQIWCRNRLVGYKDVEVTNMTTSWRDGLAFCALIHRFRPDLIDFESLSKENVFENNQLAFEVAEGLGIPALLDAEDMVRLEVPDKLSIITYVAQIHNCFKDELPVGGPDIKTASKRHSTPVQRSVTMRSPDSKRRPLLQAHKKSESHGALLSGPDICVVCDGKVYLIEKHIADGKLYHRSCFKANNRKSDANALKPASQTPDRSTAGRPSSLASSGLKKTASSVPSTPGTPPDTRPDWQKKLQEKSLAKKAAANASAGHASPHSSLETLRENQSLPESKAKSVFDSEKVKLRSRPAGSSGSKAATPRAVSVGVDLDERLSKLRQLRESAKASGGKNEAVKSRLERLQKVAAKSGSGNTTNDKKTAASAEPPRDILTEQVLDTMETDSLSSTHSNTDLSQEMLTSSEAVSTKDPVSDDPKDGAKQNESSLKQNTNPFECEESGDETGRTSPVPEQASDDNLRNNSEEGGDNKLEADAVSNLPSASQAVFDQLSPPVRPQRRSHKVKGQADSSVAKGVQAAPAVKEETPISPTALPLNSLNIDVSVPLTSNADNFGIGTDDLSQQSVHSQVVPEEESSKVESVRKESDNQSASSDVKSRKMRKIGDSNQDVAVADSSKTGSTRMTSDSQVEQSQNSDTKSQLGDRKLSEAMQISVVEPTQKLSGNQSKRSRDLNTKPPQKTEKADNSSKQALDTTSKSSSMNEDIIKKSGNPSRQSSVEKPLGVSKKSVEVSKKSFEIPKESTEVPKSNPQRSEKSSAASRKTGSITTQPSESSVASKTPSSAVKRSSQVSKDTPEASKGSSGVVTTSRRSSEVAKPLSQVSAPTEVSPEVSKTKVKPASTDSNASAGTPKRAAGADSKSTAKSEKKSSQVTDNIHISRSDKNKTGETRSSDERKRSSVELGRSVDACTKTAIGSPVTGATGNVVQPTDKMASESETSKISESGAALDCEAKKDAMQHASLNGIMSGETHWANASNHTDDVKTKHGVEGNDQKKGDSTCDVEGAAERFATSGNAISVEQKVSLDRATVVQKAVDAEKSPTVGQAEYSKVLVVEKAASELAEFGVEKASTVEKAFTVEKAPSASKASAVEKATSAPKASTVEKVSAVEKAYTVEKATSAPKASAIEKATSAPEASTVEKALSAPKASTVEKATSAPKAATVEKAPSALKASAVEKATSAPKAATVENTSTVEKAPSAPKASTVDKSTSAPKASTVEKATSAPKAATVEKATSAPNASTVEKATSAPKAATVEKATSALKASTVEKATSAPETAAVEKATSALEASTVEKATSAHKAHAVERAEDVENAGVHVVEKRNTKPPRPPVSPAATRKETSGDSSPQVADKSNDSSVKAVHLQVPAGAPSQVKSRGGTEASVVMRRQPDDKKAPPRPKTAAAGSASKSQFYLDNEHKTVLEAPPKPARQAVGKGQGGWEDALEKWSGKRKNVANRSTWYTAESYPTECNPFGDDNDDDNNTQESKTDSEKLTQIINKTDYDSTLNPFADDTEVSASTSQPAEPAKQKLKPLNPFEVSDDEEEDKIIDNRKKLMPGSDLASDKKTKHSPKPNRGQITLPDTQHKKTTPKKKPAPSAPQKTPPLKSTPKLSENKENSQNKHSTHGPDEITPQRKGNSKLDDIDEDTTLSIDMQKRKHKPAPPRPMPPKRRPQSDYGVDPDHISEELRAIERKQIQLEEKGRQLEQAIRTADEALGSQEVSNDDDDDLLTKWLETVNEKNHLVRRESELVFISQHHALETKQADIEWELREIMNRAENLKTDDDKLREENLLQQLVSLVTERSKLVDKMDDERLRQQDEDRKINMMLGSSAKSGADNSKSPAKKGGASADKKGKKKDKKAK